MTSHDSTNEQNPSTESAAADATQTGRRSSKIGHVMDSIRHAISHEQEKLFGNRRHSHASADEGEQKEISNAKDSVSPAVEAGKSFTLNENSMSAEPQPESETWGWPGLGTYPQPAKDSAEARRVSANNAATQEGATDAESESYGWPGLGDLPPPKKDNL